MTYHRRDDLRAEIQNLHKEGFSYWEISKKLEVSPSSVAYYINDGRARRKIQRDKKKAERPS